LGRGREILADWMAETQSFWSWGLRSRRGFIGKELADIPEFLQFFVGNRQ
jgi:hypothetical protein